MLKLVYFFSPVTTVRMTSSTGSTGSSSSTGGELLLLGDSSSKVGLPSIELLSGFSLGRLGLLLGTSGLELGTSGLESELGTSGLESGPELGTSGSELGTSGLESGLLLEESESSLGVAAGSSGISSGFPLGVSGFSSKGSIPPPLFLMPTSGEDSESVEDWVATGESAVVPWEVVVSGLRVTTDVTVSETVVLNVLKPSAIWNAHSIYFHKIYLKNVIIMSYFINFSIPCFR